MKKNYNLFNLSSLLFLLVSLFLLIGVFQSGAGEVQFKDPALEEAVRITINKPEGEIEPKDVDLVQTLDATGYGIESLEGIEALGELRILYLEDNFVKSVAPLATLTKLETLDLRNNEITNLEAIDFDQILFLPIRELSLRHNVKRDEEGNATRLSDISLLGQMITLRELDLRDNHVEELAPLGNLRDLKELDLRENKFDTIQALESLVELEELNLRENHIDSLEPLRYLTRLKYLNLHSVTGIESLEPLSNLVNLETLIMRNVEISDNGNFLRKLTNLQRLNAIDANFESINQEIIERLLARGALQGEVRPVRMIETLEAPELSVSSGFYSDRFELEIDNLSEQAEVYYTLDGSDPTRNSEVYTGSIPVQELDGNTFTIVRAKAIGANHLRSETITGSYLVHEQADERFNMAVFSLVTDPENLFDDEKGIYTEENAFNRGSDWERPVHVDFFEVDGNLELSQNAGIRIHGGTSRQAEQKSFRLYASSEYAEDETFQYAFYDDLTMKNSNEPIDEFKRLILRNSGNDRIQTMFNDGLVQELVREVGTVDTQAYRPAVIFINGEYFGMRNIRERLDEYYLASHYGVETEDVAILEMDREVYRGGTSDVSHYNNMLAYIRENDIKETDHFEQVQTMMDTENFIDYFASQIFFANADWPANNIQYWRKTTDEYQPDASYGHDGRWRWMLVDMDFAFYRLNELWGVQEEPLNHYHNTIQWVLSEMDGVRGNREWPNFLFRELMKNQTFKEDFLVRFNDLANSYYQTTVMLKKLDEISQTVGYEIDQHIERWGEIYSRSEWQYFVNRKYTFANERPTIIRGYMQEAFSIEDIVTVNVSNETEMGYVRVNTLNITADLVGNTADNLWSGEYFTDIPIRVEAVAKEGYVFSHWEDLSEDREMFEITPDSDMTLRAVFKAE